MNKIVKLLCAVIAVIIIFLFVKESLLPIAQNMVSKFNENINSDTSVSTRQYDKLKYKTEIQFTDKSKEVLNKVFIAINDELLENNTFDTKYEDIGGFYELQPYFLEYKLYLATKYKVQNIMSELPNILDKTANLSDDELNIYYENNKENLEKTFGIENVEEFTILVKGLKSLKDSDELKLVTYPKGIYHNTRERKISIFCDIIGNDAVASVNLHFKPYYTSLNQSAPYVKIMGIAGGIS